MIVMDCSAAVAIARDTEEGRAFQGLICPEEKIIASELYLAEVRNTFWKYVHAHKMLVEEAEFCIKKAINLVDKFIPLEDNADEAFAEAVRQNHSVYDMFYLTLVRRTSGTLFSLDKKLVTLCEDMGLNAVVEIEI